ncbi:hypothetical protein ES705_30576 [subsurface metagenome]
MKSFKRQVPSIFGYLFLPPNGTIDAYLIPPAKRLLKSLCRKTPPYFFVCEFSQENMDLENIEPSDVANCLVSEGLLIDTNISYN